MNLYDPLGSAGSSAIVIVLVKCLSPMISPAGRNGFMNGVKGEFICYEESDGSKDRQYILNLYLHS